MPAEPKSAPRATTKTEPAPQILPLPLAEIVKVLGTSQKTLDGHAAIAKRAEETGEPPFPGRPLDDLLDDSKQALELAQWTSNQENLELDRKIRRKLRKQNRRREIVAESAPSLTA